MQISNDIQNKFSFFVALSLSLFLASCGSYQYVGYDSDGIYNNSTKAVVYEEAKTIPVENQNIYKDYFTQKTLQYSEIPNDSTAIFTDIDSYEGNYTTDVIDGVQYGQSGWGESDSNVTINIYDNSWNQPWGWYAGFGWNSWGYNSWAWYNPWGFNNWGWNAGFGYGWNYWGYNNFWCPPYYRNNYYTGNNYAYNYGRRGQSQYRNVNYGRRNATRNSSASVRRRSSVQTRNTATSFRPRRTTTNTRTRTANTAVRTRSQSPRSANTSARTRSSSSRNSNSSARPSRSRSSSSSSARSSRSSSSRSSGSSRSSSRGRSGRRG